jgi:hypothetical protein
MDKYQNNGYYGGHIIELDEPEEPRIICDLCGNDCTDDFKMQDITASLSICVCPDCYNQDQVEYLSALEFINLKHKKL